MSTGRIEKVSKDGKMRFSAKTEIDGQQVNWSFVDELFDKYESKKEEDGLQ